MFLPSISVDFIRYIWKFSYNFINVDVDLSIFGQIVAYLSAFFKFSGPI